MTDSDRNAARYEWMRRGSCPFAETDPAWDSGESLDAAIDEAMLLEAMTSEQVAQYVAKKHGWA